MTSQLNQFLRCSSSRSRISTAREIQKFPRFAGVACVDFFSFFFLFNVFSSPSPGKRLVVNGGERASRDLHLSRVEAKLCPIPWGLINPRTARVSNSSSNIFLSPLLASNACVVNHRKKVEKSGKKKRNCQEPSFCAKFIRTRSAAVVNLFTYLRGRFFFFFPSRSRPPPNPLQSMKSVDLWADNNNGAVISKNNPLSARDANEAVVSTTTTTTPAAANGKQQQQQQQAFDKDPIEASNFPQGEINAGFEMPGRDSSFHGMEMSHSMQHRQRGNSIRKER